ncbi:MAG: exonuclease domain-containing protein [Candidatus Excrementavichristensenella sp.]|jgi:DNA polymerase III epsilon subunit family exonuclease
MATCVKCGKSGFTLKLDSYSLCTICQRATREELEERALSAEWRVDDLTALLERANETIQAKDAEIAEFHSRSKEIEREIADLEAKKAAAEADFEAMKAAMEAELEAKKAATEADCEAVLKNANAELAKLFLSASNRFDKYAGSLPEPKVSADKKPSAAKKKEPTVKRSKFQLVSPKSFFAGSYTGYVVLALETTGLDSKKDRIIEIGAIKVRRYRSPETFSTYVNPGMPIDPAATAIHGITDAMVAGAPTERDAIGRLVDFIGNIPYIAAHDAPLNTDFLVEACLRCDEYLHCLTFDALSFCRNTFPDLANYALETIAQKFGVRNPNPHRALGDVDALAQLIPRFEKAFRR